jgi:hypothetical protein
MIVIHKPFDRLCGTGRAKRARVVDTEKKEPSSSYRPIHREVVRGRDYLTVDYHGYALTRGKSEWVRVLPEEQEKEYREIRAEIARLEQKARDVIEEGWVRAKPYVHSEPATPETPVPVTSPETRQALDRLGTELTKMLRRTITK